MSNSHKATYRKALDKSMKETFQTYDGMPRVTFLSWVVTSSASLMLAVNHTTCDFCVCVCVFLGTTGTAGLYFGFSMAFLKPSFYQVTLTLQSLTKTL